MYILLLMINTNSLTHIHSAHVQKNFFFLVKCLLQKTSLHFCQRINLHNAFSRVINAKKQINVKTALKTPAHTNTYTLVRLHRNTLISALNYFILYFISRLYEKDRYSEGVCVSVCEHIHTYLHTYIRLHMHAIIRTYIHMQ